MKKLCLITLFLVIIIINSFIVFAGKLDDFAYREAVDAQVVQDRIRSNNHKVDINFWLKTPTTEERKTAIKNIRNNAKKPEVKALIQKMNKINDVKKATIKKKTTIKTSKLAEEQMLRAAQAAQAAGEKFAQRFEKTRPELAKSLRESTPDYLGAESIKRQQVETISPERVKRTISGYGVDPFAKSRGSRSRFSREQTVTDFDRFKQELKNNEKIYN